jgi:hypothetical protein
VTLELELSPETEAKVRQLAASTGKDIEAIVLEALAEKLAAMLRHGLRHLLTFNVRDFERFNEIELLDAQSIPAS